MAAIALTAALLASSFASIAIATDEGGSTAGAGSCTLAATGTGIFTGQFVTVPNENVTLRGDGFAPNGDGELVLKHVPSGEQQVLAVRFSGDGRLVTTRTLGPGDHGVWEVTLSQDTPACTAQADVRVLPLNDVAGSKFSIDIIWIYVEHITFGCTATRFCPDGLVTRGQMASFLVRALDLPSTSTDYFTDDETNKHEANINRLRAAGITFGCGPTTFCPDGLVTRAQMASFMVRAFELPATATDYFTDDDTNRHEANINAIRAMGITLGCGGTNFCPNGRLTRGQLAAFLHRQMED